jgi:iron complex outermembrane receptor protein
MVAVRTTSRQSELAATMVVKLDVPGEKKMKGKLIVLIASALPSIAAVAQSTAELKNLSIDELLDVQVTSVSKHSEPLADAAAPIFVITPDQIRRSGATTLPEVLRLAPMLDVARIDSVQYAISARGFNNAVGNKLLVLIDGRTVYTPLFSGVFWDQQDLLLQDIERVEVITGPGAALWGTNAVNGVINVITRPATETVDTLVVAGASANETQGAVRLGKQFAGGAVRVYGKYSQFDDTNRAGDLTLFDQWSKQQAGFRADWQASAGDFTLQGDAYRGSSVPRGSFGDFEFTEVYVTGASLLGRWNTRLKSGSALQLQAYVDHSKRDDALFFRPTADIVDVDFQYAIPGERHRVMWGAGYRYGHDDIGSGFVTTFVPQSRTLSWGNLFVQDEIALRANLQATVGVKLESNDYTGLEYLPSLSLGWKMSANRLMWGSLSRAVREPARYDRDVRFPGQEPYYLIGGPNFESEVANVIELGYRETTGKLTYSITAFEHAWDNLRSGSAIPVELENKIDGDVYGIQAWLDYNIADFWKLGAGGVWLQEDLQLKAGSTDPVGVDNPTLRNDPEFQWSLRSSFDLPRSVQLDLDLRRVGARPEPQVPAYTELNVRLAYTVFEHLELSVAGRNLLHARHPEYGDPVSRGQTERDIYGQIRWQF